MRTLAFALCLVAAGSVRAAADATVAEAEGQAAVLNGDKAQAREKAIDDALRHAVESTAGTMVTSSTEVQDFQVKMDQVLTHSKGFVKKYDLLDGYPKFEGTAAEGNLILIVKVRATIGTAELNKDLEAMGLLLARKGKPRLMLMIAEQNIGQLGPAGWWTKGKAESGSAPMGAIDQRVAENTIIDVLGRTGFEFVDQDVLAGKLESAGPMSANPDVAQVRKIANLTDAQVVINGTAIATKAGDLSQLMGDDPKDNSGPQMVSCKATISGRAINTDNGSILATDEVTKTSLYIDVPTCGKNALVAAGKLFSDEIQKKIMERWSRDLSAGNRLRVKVSGVDSLTASRQFQNALRDFVRGVKDVQQRSINNGVADLDVTVTGTSEAFAEELETKKLGKFKVKVKNISANNIDAELSH